MRNVAFRNMDLTVLGQPIRVPIGVSPVAFQKMAHPDGEIGTATGSVIFLFSEKELERILNETFATCYSDFN